MKNIFYLLLIIISSITYKAQTYPLRTYIQLPSGAYLKDTNNELPTYEGIWKGAWDGKFIYLNIKKLTIIDLDTLIFFEQYLKSKDINFKNLFSYIYFLLLRCESKKQSPKSDCFYSPLMISSAPLSKVYVPLVIAVVSESSPPNLVPALFVNSNLELS